MPLFQHACRIGAAFAIVKGYFLGDVIRGGSCCIRFKPEKSTGLARLLLDAGFILSQLG